jgi:hypothetical protein
MIAGAMLGKRVEYWDVNYHKVQALAEFSLTGLPVFRSMPEGLETWGGAAATAPGEGGTQCAGSTVPSGDRRAFQTWVEGLHRLRSDITRVVPESVMILVDDQALGGLPMGGRRVVPFLERDGHFYGQPSDDAMAIRELERLRGAGAGFIAFAWPAFWWLDYYSGLHQHLRSKYRCVLENDCVVLFDLRS